MPWWNTIYCLKETNVEYHQALLLVPSAFGAKVGCMPVLWKAMSVEIDRKISRNDLKCLASVCRHGQSWRATDQYILDNT